LKSLNLKRKMNHLRRRKRRSPKKRMNLNPLTKKTTRNSMP